MRVRASLSVVLVVVVLVAACKGGGPTGPSGGGSTSTTTTAPTTAPPSTSPPTTTPPTTTPPTTTPPTTTPPGGNASFIGTWRVLTSSGVDISALNGTFTVTATLITENWPGICQKTYTYTLSGNNLNTVLQTNTCNFPGANEPRFFEGASVISITGNTMTVTIPATGAFGTLVKIS